MIFPQPPMHVSLFIDFSGALQKRCHEKVFAKNVLMIAWRRISKFCHCQRELSKDEASS